MRQHSGKMPGALRLNTLAVVAACSSWLESGGGDDDESCHTACSSGSGRGAAAQLLILWRNAGSHFLGRALSSSMIVSRL